MQIDMSPTTGRVISRRKIDVSGHVIDGRTVLAGTIVRTSAGYSLVLIPEGGEPVTSPVMRTERKAHDQLWEMTETTYPDFLDDGRPRKAEKKPRSRARAKVVETKTSGHTPRHHGSVAYVITGETEGAIMHQVRRLRGWYQGYGIVFGEIERIDGVLTIRGRRSDNCE